MIDYTASDFDVDELCAREKNLTYLKRGLQHCFYFVVKKEHWKTSCAVLKQIDVVTWKQTMLHSLKRRKTK